MWKDETADPEASRVEIDLEISSWIEGRGVRHTDWDVRVNDAWVKLAKLHGVAKTMTNPTLSFDEECVNEFEVLPAGCQYRVTYHPRLVRGTLVRRRVSVPCSDEEIVRRFKNGGGPFRMPLRVTATEYRVVDTNKLVRDAEWKRAREQRAKERSAPVRERQISARSVSAREIEAFAAALRSALPASKTG